MTDMKKIPERSQVPVEDTWNLADIYYSDEAWQQDLEATRAWLKEQGTDVTDMSDDEIRKADTGSYVFIKLTGRIVDAMEDFSISLALLNH